MNFFQSIRACLLDYAVFKGRARRSEYWWFVLFTLVFSLAMSSVDIFFLGYTLDDTITPLSTIFDVLMVLPSTAVTARRLHDVGMSGWFQVPFLMAYIYLFEPLLPELHKVQIIEVVTLIAGIYFLGLLFKFIKDSDPGTNLYGRNPKDPDMGTVFD